MPPETLSASDLSNHLGCRHLTALDQRARAGKIERPKFVDPVLEVLKKRGRQHEAAYLGHLYARGKSIYAVREHAPDADEQTMRAMREGVDVIYQASFRDGRWRGIADFLLRVETPSELGDYSYEVADTKLARSTRAGTILQLALYSEIFGKRQGRQPARMHVVKPGAQFETETYACREYAAYYRYVKDRLESAIAADDLDAEPRSYPEPCPQCDICRWRPACNRRRRADDHLSLVAGMQTLHARVFEAAGRGTLASLAQAGRALDDAPERGSAQTFEDLHTQARAQFDAREGGSRVVRFRDPLPQRGFALLPTPSPGDVFFDIEGDAFVGTNGLEYLLGWCVIENESSDARSALRYEHVEADDAAGEKRAFERFVDAMTERRARFPDMHIYHFAPYEPAALKRLLGKYGTREPELEWLLRGERFVDLHAVLRQGLVCSVERYGLKELEDFVGYQREIDLDEAGAAWRRMEFAFELEGDITDEDRALVRGYNREDCESTWALRQWLEEKRQACIEAGHAIPRREAKDGTPSANVEERRMKVAEIYDRLMAELPLDASDRDDGQQARWLLAQALDYFRREGNVAWWEFHTRRAYDFDEAWKDRKAVAGLRFVEDFVLEPTKKRGRKKHVHRFTYPPQDVSLKEDDVLYAMGEMPPIVDEEDGKKSGGALALRFGTVLAHDEAARTIDLTRNKNCVEPDSPSVFVHRNPGTEILENALLAVASDFGSDGSTSPYRASVDLLTRALPRLRDGGGALREKGEDPVAAGIRLARALDKGVLPIQGPPGAGKSHTGAEMIVALAREGKRVGVTAVSHKVVSNLLHKVLERAGEHGVGVQTVHKVKKKREESGLVVEVDKNPPALDALQNGAVVGSVAWLWASEGAEQKLDYLFVDEAGQMSLAMVLAASRAAENLVLLGDPAQLEQPQQGAHPDGVSVSALEHLLGDAQTLPEERGLFLGETWRLHPSICAFTSEQYYDERLRSRPELEQQRLLGETRFAGAGLFTVPVTHEGNTSTSSEEVACIEEIVAELLREDSGSSAVHWENAQGARAPLTREDILIVAPYNAQLAKLQTALPCMRIGTVDKFQGQEAPVVIYSMTSSSPEDAPRGMSFLYSPNRLNVATSRARCAVILVASPRLFEPECRTPEQMRWANGLCAFKAQSRSAG